MAKVMGLIAFKKEIKDMHQQDETRGQKSFTDTVTRTATEYCEASSLHGIQYILETKNNLCGSKLLWLAIVISAAAIGVIWSQTAYHEWQGNPVLTSVRTTGKPISEIDFPAITICSQGSIIEVMENVLSHQLSEYAKSNCQGLNDEECGEAMMRDLYPGLDEVPFILPSTLMPNIGPDKAAEASTIINKGYRDLDSWDSTMPNAVSATTTTTTTTTTTALVTGTIVGKCLLGNTRLDNPDRTTKNPVEKRGICRKYCENETAEVFSYKAKSGECACNMVDGGKTRTESDWLTGAVKGTLHSCTGIENV